MQPVGYMEDLAPERYVRSRTRQVPFPVRIDDTWYDLSRYRQKHPGGPHFIDHYKGRDATEAVYAFHTTQARRFLTSLPRLDPAAAIEAEAATPPVSDITRNFRNFRQRLEKEGWWERDYWQETLWLCAWAFLFTAGVALAHLPDGGAEMSVVPLALAHVQGAWLGHDYAHGVDGFCRKMRLFAPLAIGISPGWWGEKHNTHHLVTNQMGADTDISMPPLFVWAPHPDDDLPQARHSQHLWFPLGCATVFFSWRLRSLAWAANAAWNGRSGGIAELVALTIHWLVLLVFIPLPTIFASVALAGLVCAVILTTSHLNEELYDGFQDDWVLSQFCSTRGATTRTAFTEWIWGGMQYHLEHHLFPTMPRSKYPSLKPLLHRFAEQNNLPGGYREDDEVEMILKTFDRLKQIAEGNCGDAATPRLHDISRPTSNSQETEQFVVDHL